MIVLGRIVAPYGLHGWVKVHPFGDGFDDWPGMARWWLSNDAEKSDWREVRLIGAKSHGRGLVARLEGIDDRTAAENLEGYYIAAPREVLPKTADGEYYWADLIGLKVENVLGTPLGEVVKLLETGANAVLVVVEGEGSMKRERLLPFVAQVVKEVDLAGGRLRVEWDSDW
jgi:16S rRNA processing protein RimM